MLPRAARHRLLAILLVVSGLYLASLLSVPLPRTNWGYAESRKYFRGVFVGESSSVCLELGTDLPPQRTLWKRISVQDECALTYALLSLM